jgi:hypothetical protein
MLEEAIPDIGGTIRSEGYFAATTQVYTPQHDPATEIIYKMSTAYMDVHGSSDEYENQG